MLPDFFSAVTGDGGGGVDPAPVVVEITSRVGWNADLLSLAAAALPVSEVFESLPGADGLSSAVSCAVTAGLLSAAFTALLSTGVSSFAAGFAAALFFAAALALDVGVSAVLSVVPAVSAITGFFAEVFGAVFLAVAGLAASSLEVSAAGPFVVPVFLPLATLPHLSDSDHTDQLDLPTLSGNRDQLQAKRQSANSFSTLRRISRPVGCCATWIEAQAPSGNTAATAGLITTAWTRARSPACSTKCDALRGENKGAITGAVPAIADCASSLNGSSF
ncbi:hypothetical protein O4H53_09100 [Sulfitobacter sp. G21635-S1]|nr:hypothetical protein [Sulfitobacter sp. G21635-S1]